MKKYLAECVGTFVLTLLGCGAAISLGCDTAHIAGTPAVIGTAIAFGLAVVAMAYTIGGISGCHINPAITLGCLLTGRIGAKDAGLYMVFQVIGAICAAALLCFLYGCDSGLGANGLQALNEVGKALPPRPTSAPATSRASPSVCRSSSSTLWASTSPAPASTPPARSARLSSPEAPRSTSSGFSSWVRSWVALSPQSSGRLSNLKRLSNIS